jgi:divalent metal cation (Fe/Co/Zn/Cd) transporter
MIEQTLTERQDVVRRGLWLNYATLGYNSLEALIALSAGFVAGSVALVGFGFDSLIELMASATVLWRLHSDHRVHHRARNERIAIRVIGASFFLLAIGVAVESFRTLWLQKPPDESLPGILLAASSVVVMPLLARAKRGVARSMASGALASEATQTLLCAYLSAILLAGLTLNALFGWWWADPLAALLMVPIIGREGWEALRGRSDCDCC